MAKVTLKIDGKNKQFIKQKLNLGAMKAQADFEEQLQASFGVASEMQNLYRKHRTILNKVDKAESKLAEAETEEEAEQFLSEIDELEQTEEYKAFEKTLEELQEKASEESNQESFELFDEFAALLVRVFDNQFTVDQVFDGLEVENTLAEEYSKIFAGNDTGKRKKRVQRRQKRK